MFGAIVVSDQAVAAGAVSIPGPVADTDGNWFVYQPMHRDFLIKDATGIMVDFFERYPIDSKAMRKVGANEDVALMFETVPAVGGILNIRGRMLVKLH